MAIEPGELKMEHRGHHAIFPNMCLKLPVFYVILNLTLGRPFCIIIRHVSKSNKEEQS
jgi:hypothetical protein